MERQLDELDFEREANLSFKPLACRTWGLLPGADERSAKIILGSASGEDEFEDDSPPWSSSVPPPSHDSSSAGCPPSLRNCLARVLLHYQTMC